MLHPPGERGRLGAWCSGVSVVALGGLDTGGSGHERLGGASVVGRGVGCGVAFGVVGRLVWWRAPALWCSRWWGVKVCISFALSKRLWARICPSPCLLHRGKRGGVGVRVEWREEWREEWWCERLTE